MKRGCTLGAIFGVACLLAACETSPAQGVVWRTNYFYVTGTNFAEIRQSIAKSKPWKENYDGITEWNVKWRVTLTPANGECHMGNFTTSTTITITLPWWTTPAGADAETKERWRNFHVRLFEHELGHARIALAAASELSKQYGSGATRAGDCATLRRAVNEGAAAILERFRQQEKEYDRQTSHGAHSGRK